MDLRPYLQMNRRLSGPLSRLLARLPLSPDFITFCGVVCAAFGAFAMLPGSRTALLTGALWMHLALILDNCDGEVARLKSASTPFGRWLDSSCDVAVDVLLWTGLFFAAENSRHSVDAGWLCGAVTGSVVNFGLVVWERKAGCSSSIHDRSRVREERRNSSFFSVLDTVEHNGDAAFIIWLMAAIGNPALFLIAGAVYMNLMAAVRFVANAGDLFASPPSRFWARVWKTAALGLGAWILHQALNGTDWQALALHFQNAGPSLLLILLIFPVCTAFHAMAFRALYPEASRAKMKFWELYRIKLTGEAFNKITPFIDAGGDPAKAKLMRRFGMASIEESIAALAAFRVSLVAAEILMVSSALAAVFFLRPSAPISVWGLVSMTMSAVYLFLIVVSADRISALGKGAAAGIRSRLSHLLRFSNADLRKAVLWNTAGYAVLSAETYATLHLLGVEVGMAEAFAIHALLQAVQTLTFFIPGNLGTQEGGLAFLLQHFRFAPAAGIALSVVKRARQVLWALAAMPFYYYLTRSRDPD